jgi:hypothetical protein
MGAVLPVFSAPCAASASLWSASHAAVARAAIDELLASIVIRLPLKGLLALWWAAAPRDTYQS